MDRRLAEAARLGFGCAVVPAGVTAAPKGLRVLPADDIQSALRVLRQISQTDASNGRS
jgi:DNA repair protein RadA/Sms